MSLAQLIRRNIRYYRKPYMLVMAGTIICTGVLTGSLSLGDSVSKSLQEQVEIRLGKSDYVVTRHNSYFPADFARRLQHENTIEIAPLLQLSGSVSAPATEQVISGVSINGVDDRFWQMGDASPKNIKRGDVVVNRQLAEQLGISVEGHLILRMQKPSYVHFNIPFTPDTDPSLSLRLEVVDIITGDAFGNFNLRNDQKLPYNLFLSLDDLAAMTGIPEQVNKLLIAGNNTTTQDDIDSLLQTHQRLKDLTLSMHHVAATNEIEIRYKSIFLPDTLVHILIESAYEAKPVYTYLVNSLQNEVQLTPYSFVSTLGEGEFEHEADSDLFSIFINTWLADDLQAVRGDTLLISYFVAGALRTVAEDSALFVVQGIVPMTYFAADSMRMPHFPGIANVNRCSNWEAGIPMDFSRIRDKDEDYWNRYRGTPKAFIPYTTAQLLWGTEYGSATSVRFPGTTDTTALSKTLLRKLTPSLMGFQTKAAKAEAHTAASHAVDFSQLFLGLSFFLQLAALLVIGILFSLAVQMRSKEQGILLSMGFTQRKTIAIYFLEAIAIALAGAFLGVFASVLFNYGILHLLNSVWYDIVRTPAISLHLRPGTLLTGFFVSFAVALMALSVSLYRSLKSKTKHKQLLRNETNPMAQRKTSRRLLTLSLITLLSSMMILLRVNFQDHYQDPNLFFLLGGLLLISFTSFVSHILQKPTKRGAASFSFIQLSINNISYNKGQNIPMITAMALATFLILSIGMYRTGLGNTTQDKKSGTGGFLYYIETALPLTHNLNSETGREKQGLYDLPEQSHFIQMPLYDGDEANCLNLNQIIRPRILGINAEKMIEREAFSFVNTMHATPCNNPWELLHQELGDNCIPAIADQTVIQWSLGKSIGDSIAYTNDRGQDIYLVLVAGLANSVFQGNLLIASHHFNQHFRQYQGTRVLLLEAPEDMSGEVSEELHYGLAAQGAAITKTTDRLATFDSVTNTYLDIFLSLGGIALILSTLGISVLVYANIYKQAPVFSMMQAIGIRRKIIRKQILAENMLLLSSGVLIGAIASIAVQLPGMSQHSFVSTIMPTLLLIALLLINGLLWIGVATLLSLRKVSGKALRNE